ncbi:hypothetical protein [Clostridium magnum]|uniref:Uncharacterized protein n=1 Tax=Clostridium magnum DSM 2767 TaxID=1121326 RepID=A0A162T5X7_9CLOT|nr:hypothetical protein [Clostridium magnum]KZL92277.1 hypothetical protein CLMAG_20860 [Clostridium magnum DSM 2767]SHH15201.1 hypothetical protein SAMN02745944_00141 [Clostridium magnum DSM 2767]
MKEKKNIVISILLIILITAGSYLLESVVKKQGVNSAKIIKITENNKVAAFISAEVLKQLMEQYIEQGEKITDKGPSLQLVMNAAGYSNFKQIVVKGKVDNKSITLNKNDINDKLELYLENNGTVNLYEKGNNSNFIVKGITEISVEK